MVSRLTIERLQKKALDEATYEAMGVQHAERCGLSFVRWLDRNPTTHESRGVFARSSGEINLALTPKGVFAK